MYSWLKQGACVIPGCRLCETECRKSELFFFFLCVFQLKDNQAKHVVFLSCIFYLVSSKTIVLEIKRVLVRGWWIKE